MLILGSVFALTFVLGRVFGILTTDNVKQWLQWAANIDPTWLIGTIVFLLFLDLFVAIPTLTITILAGFFLGFPAGTAAALVGMSLAAFTGYVISRVWGERPISLLVRDPADRRDMADAFKRNGPVMIVLARAAPIVPEVTACMAGATHMNFGRYVTYFSLSSVPYAVIASYAGSISSIESPQPAIYAAIFLYGGLWGGWYFFRRHTLNRARS